MIKKLLSVALVACAISANAQQVQNPGFENWQAGNPMNWGSFDAMLTGLGVTGTTLESQTSQFNSGASACLMENMAIALLGGQVLPGVVNTGAITYGTSVNMGFSAYAANPSAYTFFCKYTPAGSGDTAFSQAIFTKWNGTSRDTLGYGGIIIDIAVAAYTQVNVPINYTMAGVPDSVQLTFASSLMATVPAGSQFFVDDVNMVVTTGVQHMNADGSFSSVYPNPATNTINIVAADNAKNAKVYDATGRAVASFDLNGKITKADVSSLENGIYIYVITDEKNNKLSTSKFNISK